MQPKNIFEEDNSVTIEGAVFDLKLLLGFYYILVIINIPLITAKTHNNCVHIWKVTFEDLTLILKVIKI